MDIEQLKLILATLEHAGNGAILFGVLWLAKDFLGTLIIGLVIGVSVVKVIRALAGIADGASQRIANQFGFTRPYSPTEVRRIEEVVKLGLDAYEKKNNGAH